MGVPGMAFVLIYLLVHNLELMIVKGKDDMMLERKENFLKRYLKDINRTE
jgi:hypothetical protein